MVIKMFSILQGYIHGASFIVALRDVEFLTWRLNEDTGDYWVKFHVPSGKEIRIKVDEDDLKYIVSVWTSEEMKLNIGDKYGLDK